MYGIKNSQFEETFEKYCITILLGNKSNLLTITISQIHMWHGKLLKQKKSSSSICEIENLGSLILKFK